MVSTGRSDYPNQVNNVLCFPGIFRGALDVRASDINDEMKIAAAYAIAGLVSDEELNPDYILPAAFDPRVKDAVAKATAEAAIKSGVARTNKILKTLKEFIKGCRICLQQPFLIEINAANHCEKKIKKVVDY